MGVLRSGKGCSAHFDSKIKKKEKSFATAVLKTEGTIPVRWPIILDVCSSCQNKSRARVLDFFSQSDTFNFRAKLKKKKKKEEDWLPCVPHNLKHKNGAKDWSIPNEIFKIGNDTRSLMTMHFSCYKLRLLHSLEC